MRRSRQRRDRSQAILDAFLDPHADELLAQMLDAATDTVDKTRIAAHLGDFKGTAGSEALQRAMLLAGPGTRDLRCASVLALAKRDGQVASPHLRSALADKDFVVKDYAVIALAGAGDDSAWDEVFALLPALLKRRQDPSVEFARAIAYLAQYLNPQRRAELIRFVRDRWGSIGAQRWFHEFWPDACPDGPSMDAAHSPDAMVLRAWARSSLFRPLGAPLVFG